jgi:hypothetical protein
LPTMHHAMAARHKGLRDTVFASFFIYTQAVANQLAITANPSVTPNSGSHPGCDDAWTEPLWTNTELH